MAGKSKLYSGLLFIASLSISIGLAEFGLRMLTPFPVTTERNKKAHPKLGYVFDPAMKDVDENGFRNPPGALERRDIAVIGDSHAYGYNVSREENFPSVMAAKTGRAVYNFAIGSYGIYQYKVLLDSALEDGFKSVVVAFYLGNDLNRYCSALTTEYWKDYVRENGLSVPSCQKFEKNKRSALHNFASSIARKVRRSAIADAVRELVWYKVRDSLFGTGEISEEEYFMFPRHQTVKKSTLRKFAISASLDLEKTARNFYNSQIFFADAATAYRRAGVGLVIMLVHRRSTVVHDWAKEEGFEMDPEFVELTGYQLTLADRYKSFFDEQGIAYVDSLPPMVASFRAELQAGRNLYPSYDGHPLARGYEVMADTAISGLEKIAP